jgi:hypothetical protein
MPIEKLGIEIDAIAKDVANLKAMVQDLKDIQTAAGGAQTKMSDFQKQAEQTRSLRETFQSMGQIGLEMMAVSGGILYGIKKIATSFIDASVETEKYELTLKTLFKSAQKAKEELVWAKEFEDLTPYALQDVIKSTVIFRSFGLDARKYLGMAGDMAAVYGGDAATLESVVTGVARAMKIGAGGMDILTRSYAINAREVKKFGWSGQTEDIEGFRKALEKLLVTRFGGGMAELAKTLPAYIEGLRSQWKSFKEDVGTPLKVAILPDIAKLYEDIRKFRKTDEYLKWVQTIKDIFVGMYEAIKKTVTEAWKLLKPILQFLKTHPEFAKLAGKILFVGSALGLGIGAALRFTSQIGLTILSVMALKASLISILSSAGLAGVAGALSGITSLLLPLGGIAAAAFIGWGLGQIADDLIIGERSLAKWVEYIYDIIAGGPEAKKTFEDLELIEKGKGFQRQFKDIKNLRGLIAKGLEDIPPELMKYKLEQKLPKSLKEEWQNLIDKGIILHATPETYGLALAELDKALYGYSRRRNQINEQLKLATLIDERKKQEPQIAGVPTPADLGITPVTDIYATTRPEIDNYYYTIHFERDSVQINTLDLSPEKFKKLLIEMFNRQSLGPQTP